MDVIKQTDYNEKTRITILDTAPLGKDEALEDDILEERQDRLNIQTAFYSLILLLMVLFMW